MKNEKDPTKEAWTGGSNLSPEAMAKRQAINKTIFKYLGIPVAVVFGLIFLALVFGGDDDEQKVDVVEELVVEPVKTRVDSIKMQFSSWDGSHRKLERYIKDNMNDPDSYDHVETRYSDYGSYLLVATKFRGKNAFGGTVLNIVTAKVDINGNVFEIVSNE